MERSQNWQGIGVRYLSFFTIRILHLIINYWPLIADLWNTWVLLVETSTYICTTTWSWFIVSASLLCSWILFTSTSILSAYFSIALYFIGCWWELFKIMNRILSCPSYNDSHCSRQSPARGYIWRRWASLPSRKRWCIRFDISFRHYLIGWYDILIGGSTLVPV